MEIIRHILNEKLHIPISLENHILDKKFCFLDIETTGFSRVNDNIILIGALYADGDYLKIEQFFAENINEEKKLLYSFEEFISDFEIIINFNGDSFDIPFINSRFNHNNINQHIDKSKSVDILKIVRRKKALLGLERYNLKSIESYLGIKRKDTISGKESIEMYYEYIKTKNKKKKDIILRHNYEDIYNLTKVLKIIDIIDEKNKINIETKYENKDVHITFEIDNIKFEGNMMLIKGYTTSFDLLDEVHYGDAHVFKWYPKAGTFEMNIEVNNGKLSDESKCIYIDYNLFDMPKQKYNNLDYKLPENIVIFEHNGTLIVENIELLMKCLWNSLFSQD